MIDEFSRWLPTIQKALVGAIVAAILTFASRYGADGQMTFAAGLEALLYGLLTGFFVWLFPNQQRLRDKL